MSEKGIKRKKKSFLQKTLKYHKKGIHGKGVHIDEDSYEYFLNVLKIMNQEFESEDDRRDFVDNVFEQLNGNEVNYSSNQVVSRVIDNLLPSASPEALEKFMNIFGENIRTTCMDQFASFVIQKLIATITERYLIETASGNAEKLTNYFEWLLKVSKFVLNNLEEFIFNNYANRIMRTVVCCLIGHTKTDTDKLQMTLKENVPKEFTKILKNFSDQLLSWPRFTELPLHSTSSGFLQVFLQCLATVSLKRVKLIGVKLLNECFVPDSDHMRNETVGHNNAANESSNDFSKIPILFDNESCVRLLEIVLRIVPPKLFTQIYTSCFYNRLSTLSCHPKANFAVQKLIQFSNEKTEFEAIFDELSASFENILEQGKTGVILQLCEGCLRHKTKQSVFMQLWINYLGCGQSKETQSLISPLTIYMKRKDQYCETGEHNVQLHGSLLIQCMLKFNKPIRVVSSLLEIKPDVLSSILCNPKGCHIADAFFESEYIGEKSREKFSKTLEGYYATLATTKHGSRVFDIIWRWANVKNRTVIASELLENEAKLSNSAFGRPIIYNIALGTFRRSKEEWVQAQNSGDKVKKLFAGIVQ